MANIFSWFLIDIIHFFSRYTDKVSIRKDEKSRKQIATGVGFELRASLFYGDSLFLIPCKDQYSFPPILVPFSRARKHYYPHWRQSISPFPVSRSPKSRILGIWWSNTRIQRVELDNGTQGMVQIPRVLSYWGKWLQKLKFRVQKIKMPKILHRSKSVA